MSPGSRESYRSGGIWSWAVMVSREAPAATSVDATDTRMRTTLLGNQLLIRKMSSEATPGHGLRTTVDLPTLSSNVSLKVPPSEYKKGHRIVSVHKVNRPGFGEF